MDHGGMSGLEGAWRDSIKGNVKLLGVVFAAGSKGVALWREDGMVLKRNDANGIFKAGRRIRQGHCRVEGSHDYDGDGVRGRDGHRGGLSDGKHGG